MNTQPMGDHPVFREPEVEFERTSNGRTRRFLNPSARRQKFQFRGSERTLEGLDEEPRPESAMDHQPLYDFFERVVVVNLDHRPDRLERLHRHLTSIVWPFRFPERVRATDGRKVKPPNWWKAGGGAWGCHQSHLRIIENALMDDVESILVLEDDVFFEPDFHETARTFVEYIPDDWEQVYFGGQHLYQRKQAPAKVNEFVIRPFNVNRTHAYALHRRGMSKVYKWLTDYAAHLQHPNHHVDHRLGALHSTGDLKVFAPTRWLAGQFESHSNIKGKVMPTRLWNRHRIEHHDEPFVAVVGLHRSGSSCLAGVLMRLGVHMGDELGGYEPTGGHEAVGLAHLCEKAYPFPSTKLNVSPQKLEEDLRVHVLRVQNSARKKKEIAGGKYPHLCAMGNELKSICGKGLRVIHIDRPLVESINSLKSRSAKSHGWLYASDEQSESLQRWLWDCKLQFLETTDHLSVNYADLLKNPENEISRIIEYLGISPSKSKIAEAACHVQPGLRKHIQGATSEAAHAPDYQTDQEQQNKD